MDSPRSVASSESRNKMPASFANLDKDSLLKKLKDFARLLKARDAKIKDLEADLEKSLGDIKKAREETGDLKMEHAIVKEQLSSAYSILAESQQENKALLSQLFDKETDIERCRRAEQEALNSLSEISLKQDAKEKEIYELRKSLRDITQLYEDEKNKLNSHFFDSPSDDSPDLSQKPVILQIVITRSSENSDDSEGNNRIDTNVEEELRNFKEQCGHLEGQNSCLKSKINKIEKELDILNKVSKEKEAALSESAVAEKSALKVQIAKLKEMADAVPALELQIQDMTENLSKTAVLLGEAKKDQKETEGRLHNELEESQNLRRELKEVQKRIQEMEIDMWRKENERITAMEQAKCKVIEEKDKELQMLKTEVETLVRGKKEAEEMMLKEKEAGEGEREKLRKIVAQFKKIREKSADSQKQSEIEFAEQRGKYEAERAAAINEIQRLKQESESIKKEFNDYKTRAHSLIKTKDLKIAELAESLKQSEDMALELNAAREKIEEISMERNNVRDELSSALDGYQRNLDEVMRDSKADIEFLNFSIAQKDTEIKDLLLQIEKYKETSESLQIAISAAEEKLREYENSENQTEKISAQIQKISELESALHNAKEELVAVRCTSEELREAYEKESRKSAMEVSLLKRQLSQKKAPLVTEIEEIDERGEIIKSHTNDNFEFENLINPIVSKEADHYEAGDSQVASYSDDEESQIVKYAKRQSMREDQILSLLREKEGLEREVAELERELVLYVEQAKVLKEALREADRVREQQENMIEKINMQYLKNTVIKLLETGESETLFPVLSKLLQFNEKEAVKVSEAMHNLKKRKEDELAAASRRGNLLSQISHWGWSSMPNQNGL